MKNCLALVLGLLFISQSSVAETAQKPDAAGKIAETKNVTADRFDSAAVKIEISGKVVSNIHTPGFSFGDVEQKTSGQGFIIDTQNGYVVTSGPLVAGFSQIDSITVTLKDGSVSKATLTGYEKGDFVAALQINATELTAVEWRANAIKVGDPGLMKRNNDAPISGVVTHVFGPENSLGFVEIDKASAPNISVGAPVFDSDGLVLGMVLAQMPFKVGQESSLIAVVLSKKLRENAALSIAKAKK